MSVATHTPKVEHNPVDAFLINEGQLNENLRTFEKGLDIAGYIPFVSTVSGAIRAIAGKIQLIASGIFAAPYLIFYLTNERSAKIPARIERCRDFSKKHFENGMANFYRGFIETIPFWGNAATFSYDMNGCKRFQY
jgi:hypothetical protein